MKKRIFILILVFSTVVFARNIDISKGITKNPQSFTKFLKLKKDIAKKVKYILKDPNFVKKYSNKKKLITNMKHSKKRAILKMTRGALKIFKKTGR